MNEFGRRYRIRYKRICSVDFGSSTIVRAAALVGKTLYACTRDGWCHAVDVGEALDAKKPGSPGRSASKPAQMQPAPSFVAAGRRRSSGPARRRSSAEIRGRIVGARRNSSKVMELPSMSPSPTRKVNHNLSQLLKFGQKRRESQTSDWQSIAKARQSRKSMKPGRPGYMNGVRRPTVMRAGAAAGHSGGPGAAAAAAGQSGGPGERRATSQGRAMGANQPVLAPGGARRATGLGGGGGLAVVPASPLAPEGIPALDGEPADELEAELEAELDDDAEELDELDEEGIEGGVLLCAYAQLDLSREGRGGK